MAEEKKGATIFDLIGGVTDKKREWKKWSETDQKKFSPFIVNRWLSMRMELTELVNELQTYTIGLLRPQETYRLYYELLPTNKSFAKYIKGKSEDKFDKDLIYIKKWVTEVHELDYVKPIINHSFARERCLKVYKEAVG